MDILRSTFPLCLFKNAFKGPILKTIKCRTCAAFTATKETLFYTFWMVIVQRSKYNIHTDKWKNSCFSFLLLSGQFCGQTKVNLQNCVRFFPSICFYCNFSRILIGKKIGRIGKIKYNQVCQNFFSIISFETLPSVVVRVQNKFLQQINFWPPHPHISRSETHEQNNLIPQQEPQQFYIELQSNPRLDFF